VREVCAFLEERLGLVPGWLLSVPVKVCCRSLARGLLSPGALRTGLLSSLSPAHTAFLLCLAAPGGRASAARRKGGWQAVIPLQGAYPTCWTTRWRRNSPGTG